MRTKSLPIVCVDPIKTKPSLLRSVPRFQDSPGRCMRPSYKPFSQSCFASRCPSCCYASLFFGGMGNLKEVILGVCIMFFDRVILAQSTQLVRRMGRLLAVMRHACLTCPYGAGSFGATLIVVMVLRPEGLLPSAPRAVELHAGDEEA